MDIDYLTVKDLLAYLKSTIADIETHDVTLEHLEKDATQAAAVKYLLHTAVEACANIAEHLIFRLDLGNPTTSKEVFPILARHYIITYDLSEKLQKATGMRNILVHLYLEVNLAEVASAATIGLNDLRDFAKAINQFLEKYNPKLPKIGKL